MPYCECMLADQHLAWPGGLLCSSIYETPFGVFSSSYITWMLFFFFLFLALHTRTATIQPVHSGGCHSNRAASLFILCPVSPHRLSFPGRRRFGFCMQIKAPLIELQSQEVEGIYSFRWSLNTIRWLSQIVVAQ